MSIEKRISKEHLFRILQELTFIKLMIGSPYSSKYFSGQFSKITCAWWQVLTPQQQEYNAKIDRVRSIFNDLDKEISRLRMKFFSSKSSYEDINRAVLFDFRPFKGITKKVVEYLHPTARYTGELQFYLDLLQINEESYADKPQPIPKPKPIQKKATLKAISKEMKVVRSSSDTTQKIRPADKLKAEIEQLEKSIGDLK